MLEKVDGISVSSTLVYLVNSSAPTQEGQWQCRCGIVSERGTCLGPATGIEDNVGCGGQVLKAFPARLLNLDADSRPRVCGPQVTDAIQRGVRYSTLFGAVASGLELSSASLGLSWNAQFLA